MGKISYKVYRTIYVDVGCRRAQQQAGTESNWPCTDSPAVFLSDSPLWANWAQFTLHLLCTVIFLSSFAHKKAFIFLSLSQIHIQCSPHSHFYVWLRVTLTRPTSFHCSFWLASPNLPQAFTHSNLPHHPRPIKCSENRLLFLPSLYSPFCFQAFSIIVCVLHDELCMGLCMFFLCFFNHNKWLENVRKGFQISVLNSVIL